MTQADLDHALAAAAKSNKIVVVDFFTTWCVPCKKLDQETWHDSDVEKWFDEHAILVKLDAEKETATAARFHLDAYPTIVFLGADGSEKDRLVGFRDAKTFLSEANDALQGKTAMQRAIAKFSGSENDPMERGRFADELVRAKKYPEALEHYLWCFDHGNESVGYTGVRLSFLLSDISSLAAKYEPARKALEDRRDAAAHNLESGEGNAQTVMDLSALDEHLNGARDTLALYDRLRAEKKLSDEAEKWMRYQLVPVLAEDRRYAEVLQACGNRADKRVRAEIAQHDQMRAMADVKDRGGADLPDLDGVDREYVIKRCMPFYEAELGAGSPDTADAIATTLVEFHTKPFTFAALIDGAVRSEKYDTALALVDMAHKKLPSTELGSIDAAAAKIPKK